MSFGHYLTILIDNLRETSDHNAQQKYLNQFQIILYILHKLVSSLILNANGMLIFISNFRFQSLLSAQQKI